MGTVNTKQDSEQTNSIWLTSENSAQTFNFLVTVTLS